MRAQGLDQTRHKEPILQGDMEKMYSSGILSNQNPTALQRKVFVETGLHFARRGREGLRELRKDSFVIKKDDLGKEYVTIAYHELSKNHNGLDLKDKEKVPIMFAQGGKDCPVVSLKLYLSKLHPGNDTFYQKPRIKGWHISDTSTWYENKAMGKNTLGSMMQKMSEAANLSRTYTNHCIRATAATVLSAAGVDSRNICAITGHKNESSLKSYIQGPSLKQRDTFCRILDNHGKKRPRVSCTVTSASLSEIEQPSLVEPELIVDLPIKAQSQSNIPLTSGEVELATAPKPSTSCVKVGLPDSQAVMESDVTLNRPTDNSGPNEIQILGSQTITCNNQSVIRSRPVVNGILAGAIFHAPTTIHIHQCKHGHNEQ